MTNLTSSESIWFGDLQLVPEPSPTEKQHTTKTWFLIFMAFFIIRLILPGKTSDSMIIHQQIAEALLAGQNWGRQALVSSLNYPPLITLVLLPCKYLSIIIPRSASHLVTAISQAWALCYFLRITNNFKKRYISLTILIITLFIPSIGKNLLLISPTWIVIVPLFSILYHIIRWYQHQSLRDTIACAINAGLLIFCGVSSSLFAFLFLTIISIKLYQNKQIDSETRGGINLLIWAPFIYCAILWLLWNWLIMNNIFFLFQEPIQQFKNNNIQTIIATSKNNLLCLPLILTIPAVVLAICLGKLRHIPITILLPFTITIFLQTILPTIGIQTDVSYILLFSLVPITILLPHLLLPWEPCKITLISCIMATILIITISNIIPQKSNKNETLSQLNVPSTQEIIQCIDQTDSNNKLTWKGSRIVIPGIKAAVLFPDPQEKRFIHVIDFQSKQFFQQRSKKSGEVLHLLIPPNNGKFYSLNSGELYDIHENSHPLLNLEKQWKSGWQLWRCVITPKSHSILNQIEK